MPELYGNPYKWELRKKIRELENRVSESWARAHEDRRQIRQLQLRLGTETERREKVEQELRDLKGELLKLGGAPPEAILQQVA
jgi:chromosome segregation ATPase